MERRNGLYAFVYLIVVSAWLYMGIQYLLPYEKQLYASDLGKQLWAFLMLLLAYGGLGFLLGFSKLKSSFKGRGKWFVNFPKLLIIGLPCLYICLQPILPEIVQLEPRGIVYRILTHYKMFFYILLGYIITTSFYRRS